MYRCMYLHVVHVYVKELSQPNLDLTEMGAPPMALAPSRHPQRLRGGHADITGRCS